MRFVLSGRVRSVLFAAITSAVLMPATAQVTFDFEGPNPLDNPVVSGDVSLFGVSTEQAHGGTQSLRYFDNTLQPYESWTYDFPFDLTSGTVSVWFYDNQGTNIVAPHANPASARWGGSIILEDKSNPADFGAVEICELPYGPRYYGSEGSVDRGTASDKFESDSLPFRSIGFHQVEFKITPTETLIYVDGLAADEVQAPISSGSNLRLRFMTDSPSNGGGFAGSGTWVDSPAPYSLGKVSDWVYYDDITFTAETPTAQTHLLDFETVGGTPDYDVPVKFEGPGGGSPSHDNPFMTGFVNQWEAVTTATAAHSGTNAARFTNPAAPWKSVAFDLSTASPDTTATLWFYDSAGQYGSHDADAAAASIILEEGANPGEFLALEVTNLPYPFGGPYNYYLTDGTTDGGGYADIYSKAFQARSIGWHKVDIGIYATYTQIAIDGQLGRLIKTNGTPAPVAQGPGLDKAVKLRIMGDSASVGGFDNYVTVDPLEASYTATRVPFVYFDDISLPIISANVNDWMNY